MTTETKSKPTRSRASRSSEPETVTASTAIVKAKTGYVVSDKMDKSIVVRIDSLSPHPLYKKRVRKSKRFMVHDEANEAQTGDFVRIVEAAPTSKMKSWKLSAILRPGGSRAVAHEALQAEVA